MIQDVDRLKRTQRLRTPHWTPRATPRTSPRSTPNRSLRTTPTRSLYGDEPGTRSRNPSGAGDYLGSGAK